MKESLSIFMEKVQSDIELRDKLGQLKKDYVKQLIALSQEVGVPLKEEDFWDETMPLTDSETAEVAGGWNQWVPIFPSRNSGGTQ